MNKETFVFTTNHKENAIINNNLKDIFKKYKLQLYNFHPKPIDFQVTIQEVKKGKSYDQLKGLYRLINKILPVLKDIDPSRYFDEAIVKTLIKDKYGYYHEYLDVKSYKSLKDATIEDMIAMIKIAETFGVEMGVVDCFLTKEEKVELERSFN